MKSTTDFREFLEDMGELDVDDVDQLLLAAKHGTDFGRWRASKKDDRTFVHGDTLILCITNKAQDTFEKSLRDWTSQTVDPALASMKRKAMQKDD